MRANVHELVLKKEIVFTFGEKEQPECVTDLVYQKGKEQKPVKIAIVRKVV